MNCPYCGKEMKLEYIQGRDGIRWSEKERPVAALGFIGGGKTIDLHQNETSGLFSGYSTTAYLYEDCKKIIIDYDSED